MTVGKNKGLAKKGGKGIKKADRHAFTKKEWFKLITAPTFGNPKPAGWIPGNTTIGKRKAEENVIGRVCEVAYTDINENSKFNWRKVKMQVEKVESNNLYTSFGGMSCTREKVMSLLKKRQTLIESMADVKTNDGYVLRCFTLMSTRPVPGQKKINSYAKSSEIRKIRKLVIKIMTERAAKESVDTFANNILSDSLPEHLVREASKIYPIRFALITKVKVLKKSKIDLSKLVEESNTKKTAETVVAESGAGQNLLTKEIAELSKDQK